MAPRRVEGSILTVLMAAVFALSLVPAGAWAVAGTGRFPDTTGTLTIDNAAKDEQYKAWQILTLASFNDGDVAEDKHATDAYSYVIEDTSLWRDFFDATASNKPASGVWGSDYFTVDPNPITFNVGGTDKTYYLVTPKEDVTDNPTMKNPFSDEAGAMPITQKDETTAAEWQSTNKVQQFAQAAVNYASTIKSITADAWGTGAGADLILTTDGVAHAATDTQAKLPLGWYVVDSTQGTLCSLDTLNPNVEITDKNDLPELVKKVQEDSIVDSANAAQAGSADDGDNLTGYQDVDDAEVGELVYYRSVIKVKDGAVNYVLRDYMDPGLTWDTTYGVGGVQVWFVPSDKTLDSTAGWMKLSAAAGSTVTPVKTNASGATYSNATTGKEANATAGYYTLSSSGTYNNGLESPNTVNATETFEVAFENDFTLFLSDNIDATTTYYYLVVDYRATVNEKAVVAGEGNLNRTYLEYGQKDAKSQTPQDQTRTYTWPVHAYKYTDTPTANRPLAGAVFELWNNETATTAAGQVKKYSFVLLKQGDVGYVDGQAGAQYKVIEAGSIPRSATESTVYYNADGTTNDATAANAAYSVTKKTADIDLGSGEASSHEFFDAITTDATGKFSIAGLDDDTYYLRETQAPNGYNKLSYAVKAELTSSTTQGGDGATTTDAEIASLTKVEYVSTKRDQSTYDTATAGGATTAAPINIVNHSGTELPSTGGIGTTIFYVAGTVLVVGAAVMLVAKRRMGAEA